MLAGQNEAGKSAVIEALNFFRNGPTEDYERLHRRKDEHPQVICEFTLTDADIEEISKATEQNDELLKYLKKNRTLELMRGDPQQDNFDSISLTEATQAELGKFFPESTTPAAEQATEITEPSESEAIQEGTKENQEIVTANDGGQPISEKIATLSDFENLLNGMLRQFVFYDVFNDLLPGVVKTGDMQNYPAVQDFEKVFNVNFADVTNREERAIRRTELRLQREASDNLNTYWKQQLEEGGKYNFTVKITPHDPIDTASKIEFTIDRDDGDPLFMEQKSKGFRWFSSFNLRLRALGIDKSTIKKLVILIDEPGQGLHEKAQKDVKRVLEELAEDGAQIIYTTHYPNLIGTQGEEFSRIRLVSNTKTPGTRVETVAQFASRSDQGAIDALAPLVTAMGVHSIHSLLGDKRLNVVVEGISDHYYMSAFKKLLGKEDGFCFLPACGVTNVPNLVSVLIGWGLGFTAVFDDDKGSGRKTYNLLKNKFFEKNDDKAHEYILKLTDCDGIEDVFEQKDFYKFVLDKKHEKGVALKNSKIAGDKKELLARLFLERVEKGEVALSATSKKRISKIFDWLYKAFDIRETASTS